jgi:hypothetical protein
VCENLSTRSTSPGCSGLRSAAGKLYHIFLGLPLTGPACPFCDPSVQVPDNYIIFQLEKVNAWYSECARFLRHSSHASQTNLPMYHPQSHSSPTVKCNCSGSPAAFPILWSRDILSRFRLGVLNSPTLTLWWDVWVSRYTTVSTWCSVTAAQISQLARWVIAEILTWVTQLRPGSVGTLPAAWARTLARSFGAASDNTGVSALSPFLDIWSYRGFDASARPSVICPVFTNGEQRVSSHTQRTRLLCDLLLSLDRAPLSGHLLFFPAGRSLATEWELLFPDLGHFRFQHLTTGLRAKKVFLSDSGYPAGLFKYLCLRALLRGDFQACHHRSLVHGNKSRP